MKKYIAFLLVLILTLCACTLAEGHYWLPDWASNALKLPNGITLIEDGAFNNTTFTGVIIPDSVERVRANAFAQCPEITRICVFSNDTVFEANALGTRDEQKEIWAYHGSTAEAYANAYGYTFVRIYADTDKLVEYAVSKLGTKYVRGQWDCVLFVRACYLNALGIRLPDTCRAMEKLSSSSLVSSQHLQVKRITDIRQLKTGDIICWCNDSVQYCTHVGMYLGAGTVGGKNYTSGVFIENSNGAGKVRYNYIPATGTGYYTRNFICAWRILP